MVTYEDTQKAKADPIYMEKLMRENDPMVWFVYKKYWGNNDLLEVEDVIQVGRCGLYQAIMGFKDMDIKFMTFAARVIYNIIQKEFRHRKRKRCYGVAVDSLQMPISEDGSQCLGDMLEDTSSNVEEKVLSSVAVGEFFKNLEGRDLEIIKMRMAEKTQEEIGEKFGVKQSIISRNLKRMEKEFGIEKPKRIKTGCDKVKVGNADIDKIAKAIAEWMVSNPNRTPNIARIVKDAGLVWGEGFKDSEYMKPAITKLKNWGYQVEEVDFNLWVVVPTVKVYYDMSYKNSPKEEKKEEIVHIPEPVKEIVHIPEPVKEEIKSILKKDMGEAKENTVIVKEMVEKMIRDAMEFRYSKTNTDVEALKNLIDILNGMIDMDENAKLDISVVVKVA